MNNRGNPKDLTGQRFGRLVAVESVGRDSRSTYRLWRCICDCGNECYVNTNNLTSGDTRSCGCLKSELTSKRNSTHHKSNHRLYAVWSGIKYRCYNKHCRGYENYGGRGISVCDEWLNSFESFYEWAIDNGYDEDAPRGKCTIDRIDNDGNYDPSNCRIVDMKTQARNRRKFHRRRNVQPVEQLDKNGNVVQRYDSIVLAEEAMGHPDGRNISATVQGRQKTAYGYGWRRV